FGRGKQSGGADRAGDETRLRGGAVLVGDGPGQRGGGAVDVVRLVSEAIFLGLDNAGAEGIGLDDVGTHFEEGSVDGPDDVRLHDGEVVVVPLLAAVFLFRQFEVEDGGSHGAVVEDWARFNEVDDRGGHGSVPP